MWRREACLIPISDLRPQILRTMLKQKLHQAVRSPFNFNGPILDFDSRQSISARLLNF